MIFSKIGLIFLFKNRIHMFKIVKQSGNSSVIEVTFALKT